MTNLSRWYRRDDGVSNRRLIDIDGHSIFMNAPIPTKYRRPTEGWEARADDFIVGIVWTCEDQADPF